MTLWHRKKLGSCCGYYGPIDPEAKSPEYKPKLLGNFPCPWKLTLGKMIACLEVSIAEGVLSTSLWMKGSSKAKEMVLDNSEKWRSENFKFDFFDKIFCFIYIAL